jgi:Subtilase family/LGFP repeat
MSAQMIADKLDQLLFEGFNPGPAVGDVIETFDGGATQAFEFAQIWAHPRVGAFECHGLILDTYRAMGAEMSRLGYPSSDEFDDPEVAGGRMNSFEFGRLRWELFSGVSTEFDEFLQVSPWLVVKRRDQVAPFLGAGESLSLQEFVQLLEPFAPEGSLDPLLQTGLDVEFTRAWEPVTPEELQSLVDLAASMEPEAETTNLEAFLRLVVPDFFDSQFIANILNGIPDLVELAYVTSEPDLPVVGTGNPNFSSLGYLKAAPQGVNSVRAWQLGADGSGLSIIDIEKGWFLGHQDLPAGIALLAGVNSPDSHYHGTAVLGVLVANDDSVGGVGLAPAARCHVMSWWTVGVSPPELATRIIQAVFHLSDGDVLLLEAQLHAEIDGIIDTAVPAEIDLRVFRAIQLATQLGIVVIEAAGNGGSNLAHYRGPDGKHVFDPSRPLEFRDSGAIMVGSATPTLPRTRHPSSNFGRRVDCHSWGDGIMAPGAFPAGGVAPTVTATSYWPQSPGFGHTSGASAIIAGVALLAQDLAVRLPSGPGRLRPPAMRSLLGDPSLGTSTSDAGTGPIGPQPDLSSIAARFGAR